MNSARNSVSCEKMLASYFRDHPRIAMGYSGGVDSSFLLHSAHKMKVDVLPVYVRTQFTTDHDLESARRFCSEEGVELVVSDLDVLSSADVASNGPLRCYYCKSMIFGRIIEIARERGYEVVVDGTNASDSESDRPGFRALRELGVESPLRECGITKSMVRRISMTERLTTWNAPSNSCLATRIGGGVTITEGILKKVHDAETALSSMGFWDFRVRTDGECAMIQFSATQYGDAMKRSSEVLAAVAPYFQHCEIDEETRI